MKSHRIVIGIITCYILVQAQYNYYYVTSVNTDKSTAFSNSHKIAVRGDWLADTVHLVFHDDSVYYTYTCDGGPTWSIPLAIAPGTHPALDIDDMALRHVAWQQFDSVDSTDDVYYDCLDDWAPPINISESSNNSTYPDLVIDENSVAHIVWSEQIGNHNYIFYRTCIGAMPGDTVRVSEYGSAYATHAYPSISLFGPADRIYVAWDCFDSGSYSPYQIHVRYKEGANWSDIAVHAHYLPLRHSSLDFGHGEDTLSLCYEDSSSGNLEATFVGGNGGGYTTQGKSQYPIVATVGGVWSYLYWQEDSAGYEDIYCHLYYFTTGWSRHSVRSLFGIDEPVRYPNCCGANLVWTQGNVPPFSIYYADFGYPIGINEITQRSQVSGLEIVPNPFVERTEIRYEPLLEAEDPAKICIYSAVGQLVKTLTLKSQITNLQCIVWDGTDNHGKRVPTGAYFCVLEPKRQGVTKKVVRLE